MYDGYDNIINDIDNRQKENNTNLVKVIYPKPKKGELTADQKKEIVNYYVNHNFKKVTAEEISKEIGIPIEKAKNFISNSNRKSRTNNINTLQLLTEYLEQQDILAGDSED